VVSANVNSVASRFKFGGKEFNDELGLDWYDFGARNYDAALGRWMNIDPLADFAPELTPYRYAASNPIFFNDPDGLWEFRYDSDTETLSLVKTKKDDDWKRLRTQTGLTKKQLKSMFGEDYKEKLDNLAFEDGETSEDGKISVSKIGGKQGEILQSIEKGLSELNKALKELSPTGEKNNCWGTCTKLSKDGEIDPNGLMETLEFRKSLLDDFRNVNSPDLGDVVRYAQDNEYNIVEHGTLFLLKNEKGTQMFTKNGRNNAQLYQLMYENEMLKKHPGYGERRGLNREVTTSTTGADGVERKSKKIVEDSSPYYRPNN